MAQILREVKFTKQFKKDRQRELQGKYRKSLDDDLKCITDLLRRDCKLDPSWNDHQLKGKLQDCRDLHLHGLVLIYKKYDNILSLERLGSHSEVF